jgi:pimeloyl-ACP methyl ester carboxylesterase
MPEINAHVGRLFGRTSARKVAPDVLGFGRSEHPKIDYSLDLYVEMLGALLDELDLGEVTLIGNCMGVATVLRYAAQHPERVKRVVAVNVLTDRTAAGGALRPLLWISRAAAARRTRLRR